MTEPPMQDPSNTREEILAATYRSLESHGYVDLTIAKIGEASETSPSLIYHYFEDKDDLVLSALEHLLDSFDETVTAEEFDAPEDELEAIIGYVFDDEDASFGTLLELRAQAIHDEAYREHFARSDEIIRQYTMDVIERGIVRGSFRACDPAGVADMIFLVTAGALMRRATGRDPDTWLTSARDELERYLETCLYRA